MSGLQRDEKYGWYYVSKNGIRYALEEGFSIGSPKKYTSNFVYITLWADLDWDDFDEFVDKYENSVFFVGFWQIEDDEDDMEKTIEKCVDEYEKINAEMINDIISRGGNITTW